MLLHDLIAPLPRAALAGPPELEVTGLADDSRMVGAGDLFVAVRGETVDGHDFIEGALEKDGFDQGFDRMADIPQKVLEAFEHDCPAETPKARELALGVAKDLHIESKVPWLNK